jgi:hypothetical protein
MNKEMDCYTDAGIAHAELLPVTCLGNENPLRKKDLLLSVQLQENLLLPPVPQNEA